MSKTVLDIVQNILSDMDSDEVNSIGDTIEAQQVGACVKRIYDQIVTDYDLPAKEIGFQLEGLADILTPTHMTTPYAAQTIKEIRYDQRKSMLGVQELQTLTYLTPQEFIQKTSNIDTSVANVVAVELDTGLTIGIYNDRPPKYWTSFDQTVIIMDSFDTNIESTLHSSKTFCFGAVSDTIIISDSTVITLPQILEELLISNAEELAFDLYKGSTPGAVKNLARKAKVRMQRAKDKYRRNDSTGPNYGRKGHKRGTAQSAGIDSGTNTPLPDWWT